MCVLSVSEASFTPTGLVSGAVGTTSERFLLPANTLNTKIIVTNLGQVPLFVMLGDLTVVASLATSFPVLPNTQFALAINASTYIAAISSTDIPEDGFYVNTGY